MKKNIWFRILFNLSFIFLISCEQIVLEDNISDKEVVLVAPQDNAQFNSTSVTFTWEAVQYAQKYRLQIAKPSFVAPTQIVLDTEITTTTTTTQLPIGTYQWRVQAISGNTTTAYKTRAITINSNQNFQDNTVVLTNPANNFVTKNTVQALTWQSIIGATNYQLQIYDSNNTIISDQTTANTGVNYTFAEGNFNWRVRASNGSENTFYTSNAILVDTTAPNTPTLSSPANTSVTSNTSISFQWSRASIAGSTEYDKISIYRDSGLTNLHSETQSSSPYNVTLTAGTYYWFVKGFDAAGNESNRSTVFSLTVN